MRSRRGYFKGLGSVPGPARIDGHGRIYNYWKRLKKLFNNAFGLLVVGFSVLSVGT
ncbi:MAG: hypothetical protein BMS9Abin01_1665 [Gammaproteobacteria bacterium]|nr:MAG: hypothetical protein BMS9Abin01_1665 [Gammaproteobacteria bacterium]